MHRVIEMIDDGEFFSPVRNRFRRKPDQRQHGM
jgi:hypothetical protein